MSKKVLVLGGTYFMGFYSVKKIIQEGFEVTTLNRGSKKGIHGANVEEIYCDRNNHAAMKDVLRGRKFDYVVDFSCFNALDAAASCEALDISSIKRYIFISSSSVYIPSDILPIKEFFPKGENKFWGDYGINKVEAENYFFEQNDKKGLPIVALRPPYMYGDYNNVYREAQIFDRLNENKPILLPGKGDTLVQFFHVDDLYQTVRKLFDYDGMDGKAFNVGNKTGVTFKEWVEYCMDAYGKHTEIIEFDNKKYGYDSRDFFPFYDYQYVLDSTEIEKVHKPQMDMLEGLKKALEWYKNNEEFVEKRIHRKYNEDKILTLLNKKY